MDQLKHGSGFAAGTLVHTDQGLVPIQDIKVGDMVLSRHESGEGELAYKRVTQTFITENQPIWAMRIGGLFNKEEEDYEIEEFLFLTDNNPFWKLEDQDRDIIDINTGKWMSALNIEYGDALVDFRGIFVDVLENGLLYQTNEAGKAFYMVYPDSDEGIFLEVNSYKNQSLQVPKYVGNSELMAEPNWNENEDPISDEYITKVYNIKVEDCHTYFVGELGVWVHSSKEY